VFRGIQQTTILAKQLKDIGIDLIDVSSGGNYAGQKIPVGPGYQVPFAAHIKKEVPGLTVSFPSVPRILTTDPIPTGRRRRPDHRISPSKRNPRIKRSRRHPPRA
jgi:hypothetical protein